MTENPDFNPLTTPWDMFDAWLALAAQKELNDPTAMSLATVGRDGMPSVRIVLLKGHDARGFTFFTNQESRKGQQLALHPRAALCWHWKSLRRQVRAEGHIALATAEESDAYFATRSRGSQIGAWASPQSDVLQDGRSFLEQRVQLLEKQYEGKPIPRPPHWGGYRLTPLRIEFWQDREFRLHDRFLYRREKEEMPWIFERLAP